MKRKFAVSVFGSFIGAGLLLVTFGATGIAVARDVAARNNPSQVAAVSANTPLTSTFTYQGQLKNAGNLITDTCDFQFGLWDALSNGGQIGITQTLSAPVNGGHFTVLLNAGNPFGVNAFNGDQRWLSIAVRCPAGSGAYTPLAPRQPLTAAPYALFSAAPWMTSGGNLTYSTGNVGLGTTTPAHHLSIQGGPLWTSNNWSGALALSNGSALGWQANNGGRRFGIGQSTGGLYFFDTSSDPGTTTGSAIYDMVINDARNVGIGTSVPNNKLTVFGSADIVGFLRVGGNTGGAGQQGDIVARRSATTGAYYFGDSINNYLYFDGTNYRFGTGGLSVDGNIQGNSFTSPSDALVNATGRIALRTSSGGLYGEAVTIQSNGNVGIGNTNPTSRLTVGGSTTINGPTAVHGPDNDTNTIAFNVLRANGASSFRVYDDGGVGIDYPYVFINTTQVVCVSNDAKKLLIPCGSAAEYVPSAAGVHGYPEMADLVSIVSNGSNPYGDTHSPFVVRKSATPCDANLLGFIVDPKSGASGKKLNEHYLPLAIYGYFPAKVTLENGAIKRGDPLTSSSKPGYAMKATGACKIIGYALEDADHEGQIQVFANHGESTAPAVTSLQAQVQSLEQTVADLKQENAALDARLTALEKALQVKGIP